MSAVPIWKLMARRVSSGRPIAFIKRIPWTAASYDVRTHFAQFGRIQKCRLPFNKSTGFHSGIGWVQFTSQEELQNVLQETHIIDGVKLQVLAQKPMDLPEDQTFDE